MPDNTPPPPSFDEIEDEMGNAPDQLNEEPFVFIEDDDLYPVGMDEGDDSILTYVGHNDSVFCCNFDKSGNLAVTGGQDDKAVIWDTNTGETKFTCTGHTDSVVAADFNHDSSLVCTGDMDGLIKVWDVESGTQVWSMETSEITWIAWHPNSNILFAGTTDGDCWKWSVPSGDVCSLFPSNGSGSACGQLFADGSKCAIGYMDGSVRVYDTAGPSVIGSLTGKDAHSSNVISIACRPDGNLIVTGSEDGKAKLIRTSNCKVLHTWECSRADPEPDERESVESVAFFKSYPLVATGTSSGNLRIWDLATYQQRAMADIDGPIVKLICSDITPLVYVASVGDISLYDGRTAELQKRWIGQQFDILDIALSEEKEKLLAASDNNVCKIFKT